MTVPARSSAACTDAARTSATRPYTLLAELTYRCPLRCLYCSNPIDFARAHTELATDEWRRVFAEAAALGVMQVHLSGGEPLMREDLEELIADARANRMYTNLITGGTLLDEPRLGALRAAGLDHVQLSIQDSAADAADFVAGAPVHRKKIAAVQIIGKSGVAFTLNVVIHRFNIGRVDDLIRLAAELGAQRLELASTQFYAWASENRAALMPSASEYAQAEEIARAAIAQYRGVLEIAFVRNDYLTGEPKACTGGWGRTIICIDPAGRVTPCQAAAVIPGLKFFNVRDYSLSEIWRDSPAMNAFRGGDWMSEPCLSCPRKEIDFGGCRCQAFLLTGSAAATDPACRLAPNHRIVAAARAESSVGTKLSYRDVRSSRILVDSASNRVAARKPD
jgi:PqqA peptide cyclase